MCVLIRGFPSARIRPRGPANKFLELRLSLIDRRILLARLIPHSFQLIRLAVFSLVTQCFLNVYGSWSITYYKSLSFLLAVYLLLFYSFTVYLFRGKERQRNPLFFRSYYCFIHMAIAVTFIVRPIFEDHVFWTIFAEGTKRNTLIQRSVKYLVRRLAVAIHRRLLAQVRRALA